MEEPITVFIPGMCDLFKFFQEVNRLILSNPIKLIFIDTYSPRRVKAKGLNKMIQVFPDIIRERRYLKRVFEKYFAGIEGFDSSQ